MIATDGSVFATPAPEFSPGTSIPYSCSGAGARFWEKEAPKGTSVPAPLSSPYFVATVVRDAFESLTPRGLHDRRIRFRCPVRCPETA